MYELVFFSKKLSKLLIEIVMVNLYIFCSCLGVFLFWRRSGVFFYRLGIGLGFYFGGSILDFDLYRIRRILFCRI